MQGKGQGQQQLAAVEPPHCGWFLEVDPSSTLVSAHSTMAKKKKKRQSTTCFRQPGGRRHALHLALPKHLAEGLNSGQ